MTIIENCISSGCISGSSSSIRKDHPERNFEATTEAASLLSCNTTETKEDCGDDDSVNCSSPHMPLFSNEQPSSSSSSSSSQQRYHNSFSTNTNSRNRNDRVSGLSPPLFKKRSSSSNSNNNDNKSCIKGDADDDSDCSNLTADDAPLLPTQPPLDQEDGHDCDCDDSKNIDVFVSPPPSPPHAVYSQLTANIMVEKESPPSSSPSPSSSSSPSQLLLSNNNPPRHNNKSQPEPHRDHQGSRSASETSPLHDFYDDDEDDRSHSSSEKHNNLKYAALDDEENSNFKSENDRDKYDEEEEEKHNNSSDEEVDTDSESCLSPVKKDGNKRNSIRRNEGDDGGNNGSFDYGVFDDDDDTDNHSDSAPLIATKPPFDDEDDDDSESDSDSNLNHPIQPQQQQLWLPPAPLLLFEQHESPQQPAPSRRRSRTSPRSNTDANCAPPSPLPLPSRRRRHGGSSSSGTSSSHNKTAASDSTPLASAPLTNSSRNTTTTASSSSKNSQNRTRRPPSSRSSRSTTTATSTSSRSSSKKSTTDASRLEPPPPRRRTSQRSSHSTTSGGGGGGSRHSGGRRAPPPQRIPSRKNRRKNNDEDDSSNDNDNDNNNKAAASLAPKRTQSFTTCSSHSSNTDAPLRAHHPPKRSHSVSSNNNGASLTAARTAAAATARPLLPTTPIGLQSPAQVQEWLAGTLSLLEEHLKHRQQEQQQQEEEKQRQPQQPVESGGCGDSESQQQFEESDSESFEEQSVYDEITVIDHPDYEEAGKKRATSSSRLQNSSSSLLKTHLEQILLQKPQIHQQQQLQTGGGGSGKLIDPKERVNEEYDEITVADSGMLISTKLAVPITESVNNEDYEEITVVDGGMPPSSETVQDWLTSTLSALDKHRHQRKQQQLPQQQVHLAVVSESASESENVEEETVYEEFTVVDGRPSTSGVKVRTDNTSSFLEEHFQQRKKNKKQEDCCRSVHLDVLSESESESECVSAKFEEQTVYDEVTVVEDPRTPKAVQTWLHDSSDLLEKHIHQRRQKSESRLSKVEKHTLYEEITVVEGDKQSTSSEQAWLQNASTLLGKHLQQRQPPQPESEPSNVEARAVFEEITVVEDCLSSKALQSWLESTSSMLEKHLQQRQQTRKPQQVEDYRSPQAVRAWLKTTSIMLEKHLQQRQQQQKLEQVCRNSAPLEVVSEDQPERSEEYRSPKEVRAWLQNSSGLLEKHLHKSRLQPKQEDCCKSVHLEVLSESESGSEQSKFKEWTVYDEATVAEDYRSPQAVQMWLKDSSGLLEKHLQQKLLEQEQEKQQHQETEYEEIAVVEVQGSPGKVQAWLANASGMLEKHVQERQRQQQECCSKQVHLLAVREEPSESVQSETEFEKSERISSNVIEQAKEGDPRRSLLVSASSLESVTEAEVTELEVEVVEVEESEEEVISPSRVLRRSFSAPRGIVQPQRQQSNGVSSANLLLSSSDHTRLERPVQPEMSSSNVKHWLQNTDNLLEKVLQLREQRQKPQNADDRVHLDADEQSETEEEIIEDEEGEELTIASRSPTGLNHAGFGNAKCRPSPTHVEATTNIRSWLDSTSDLLDRRMQQRELKQKRKQEAYEAPEKIPRTREIKDLRSPSILKNDQTSAPQMIPLTQTSTPPPPPPPPPPPSTQTPVPPSTQTSTPPASPLTLTQTSTPPASPLTQTSTLPTPSLILPHVSRQTTPPITSILSPVAGQRPAIPAAPHTFSAISISFLASNVKVSTAMKVFEEALRILRPGGRIYLVDFNGRTVNKLPVDWRELLTKVEHFDPAEMQSHGMEEEEIRKILTCMGRKNEHLDQGFSLTRWIGVVPKDFTLY